MSGAAVLLQDDPIVAPLTIECDACGQSMPDVDRDEGFDVPGHGVYVWTRGSEVRFEKAPLCGMCAAAIGVAAFGRIQIEEEEG